MRLIRSLLALVLMRVGFAALDAAYWLRWRPADRLPGPTATRYSPVEQVLLGSIVSLAICALWIWFSARAGR
jgi:hypothetical protein